MVEHTEEKLEVNVTYKIKKNTIDPVFGISIFNPFGQKILETNTKWDRIVTGSYSAERHNRLFGLFNILTNGLSSITVAAANKEATEFYDWWNEAYIIDINKDRVTSALTLPNHKVTLRRKK